jgi:perosamine synthetase
LTGAQEITTRAAEVAEFIPLMVPEIRGNEWRYVKKCLDSNWVSSVGAFVDRFEREVAAHVGSRFGVATVNGTSALHIALLVAGIKPDDDVLVSTLTFIAPANAIRYVGAWPVFIDAEPDYWQMDPEKLETFLAKECRYNEGRLYNRRTGRQVTAIIPVHILGHPVDLDPILELARRFGLKVIEDATEALGAEYKRTRVGSGGDIACFSFNGNKIVTTGGGGMLVTDDEQWALRAKHLTTQAKADAVEYVHNEIGYNYRLTNLQAALGCAQMENLEVYLKAKRQIAERYREGLQGVAGVRPMKQARWAASTYWMYTIAVDETEFGMSSRELLRYLRDRGIETRPLWQPIHLSPAYVGPAHSRYKVAERLFTKGLSLPCSSGLTLEQQERVIAEITSAHASVRKTSFNVEA